MRSRLLASLAAGGVAIAVNTTLLSLADAVHFTTARGGLLRLLRNGAAQLPATLSLQAPWRNVLAPVTSGSRFGTIFHVMVGLLMALFYAYLLERRLPGRALAKGLWYALGVWLLNACVVLPLIGEGFAGSLHLPLAGMVGFAAIHTTFFVLLAVLYARWRLPSIGST